MQVDKIAGQVGDTIIKGEPDGLIARGLEYPETPFFCLNEYKKEESADDGLGQLLAAMLVAQSLNEGTQPIYGAYVYLVGLGFLWSWRKKILC